MALGQVLSGMYSGQRFNRPFARSRQQNTLSSRVRLQERRATELT